MSAPSLRPGTRLIFDEVRQTHALLYPEGVLLLDEVAADVVRACDGRRDLASIVEVLSLEYDGVQVSDVERLIARVTGTAGVDGAGPAASPAQSSPTGTAGADRAGTASPPAQPSPTRTADRAGTASPPAQPSPTRTADRAGTASPPAQPSPTRMADVNRAGTASPPAHATPTGMVAGLDRAGTALSPALANPIGMVAELTYRCPLQCAYCSNPVELSAYHREMTAHDWLGVLDQARAAGVLQVHFSGGEPLLRRELPGLVAHARELGMYTNLVTSGIPLTGDRLAALAGAGLDHLQLSIQDAGAADADRVAGGRFHERKLAVAALVREAGIPLTINVVLHAGNVDRLGAIADLAAGLGADRLELAHTQYYGWGLRNRSALLPSPDQVERAAAAAAEVHARHGDRLEVVYVEPDYHTGRPKPCMQGWGGRQFVVAPNGDMLPCLAAGQLPGFTVPSVRTAALTDIWTHSALFNSFRGTDWMSDPCRTCALRHVDFGGCRCQAFQLTGDPAATDPACELSPHHELVRSAARLGARAPVMPRRWR